MRIGIDAYPLVRQNKAGIGYYAYYMIKYLLEIDSKNEYFLYSNLNDKIELSYPNLRFPFISSNNLINRFSTSWMMVHAKRQLLKDNLDVFWGTQGIIPLNLPKSIKTIVTNLDMVLYLYPKTMEFLNYFVNKFYFKRSIFRADKIIPISDTTANDLTDIFKSEEVKKKIEVVYCGVDINKFKITDKAVALKYISRKFNVAEHFILFTGTIEPRKNIVGLLEAFKLLKTTHNVSHQLVIVGAKGWQTSQIFEAYKKLAFKDDEVKILGYVEEKEIAMLYSAADVFVIPSLYEGFGLTPLEAMASGTPVVASDIPIFREILDNSALLVDTLNPNCLAGAIFNVLSNNQLKESLIYRGFLRCQNFSWGDSAKKIVKIFEDLAG
ncbi:MAG: glycosyltransferase family 4 protein [Candidatus Omnitrophica bacterium]|nr:glycosyltransferase family 4 protein [Candidatus Omnitrophota bacterium]